MRPTSMYEEWLQYLGTVAVQALDRLKSTFNHLSPAAGEPVKLSVSHNLSKAVNLMQCTYCVLH